MEPKELYDKIMAIDQKIRFATILDNDGNIQYSGHREGIHNLLNPEESKKSLQQAVNAWKVRNDFASKIGEGLYVLASYDKINRITLPYNDHLLYVTTDHDANHNEIINKLTNL